MLNDNLQKLTDRLYEEGLSKGKQEGEELVAKAKTEAEKIVEAAKEQAKAIIAEAEKKAVELTQKTEADIKMASVQSITATQHEIESMIVTKTCEKPVNELLSTPDFVKEMITSIVKAFNPDKATPTDLDIILPETLKDKIGGTLANEIKQQLGATVSLKYSNKISGGFKIGPKDGGYTLQFTDDEFKQLISSYLRPATRKLLFG